MSPATNIATSWYHSVLRISVLIFAIALVFESGLFNPVTRSLTHTAGQQFASVIIGSADNAAYDEEVTTLTETQINVTTPAIDTSSAQPLSKSTFLLSVVVFIFLLLIVLNYILAHLRGKERQHRFS
jgi:hypothetical protein